MKKLKQILLVLLAAALPTMLQAQSLETFTFATNRLVPDGDISGLADVENVNSSIENISSLKVSVKITGEFNGDAYAYLQHSNGFAILLNRVGTTASNPNGYGDSGLDVTFAAGATNGDIHIYQNVTIPTNGYPLTGEWEPDGRNVDPTNVTDASVRSTSLTNFANLNGSGQWTLYLADMQSGGTNMLNQWSLQIYGTATPALSWANPADITYGTGLSQAQLNATVTYDSTNVPGTFSYSSLAGSVLNAGSNQTLSVTFTPADTNSFSPVTTNVSINVLPAPLVVAVNDTNSVYGSGLPAFTASYNGFVNGDTVSNLAIPPAFATAAMASSGVGQYNITASGAVDADYSISYVAGTLTITPATLTITADNQSKVYGAVLPSFTASYSGFVNGDTVNSLTAQPILSTSAAASSGVGHYDITASRAADVNYTINYAVGSLTITPAALTVTADNATKVYGAALPAFTASYAGFVNGDTVNTLTTQPTFATSATASSGAGAYDITASSAVDENYNISYVNGTLTITQALTTGTVVSSANPANSGSNVVFTMTVAAAAPGAGTPAGTVNFLVDGEVQGSTPLGDGVATFATSALTHGTHTVVAEYAGDSNFVGTTNSLAQVEVIDTTPVAGNVTIYRNRFLSAKVQLSTLLTNATDAEGDTLSITVSPASASNATITVSGGWVFYTPPAGFTNADWFTYTVTDNYGRSATGTVSVDIQTDNDPTQNLRITALGGNQYLINGYGVPGRVYDLQYTDSLNPANWLDLPGASLTADTNGGFEYTDTSTNQMRFYRSVYP